MFDKFKHVSIEMPFILNETFFSCINLMPTEALKYLIVNIGVSIFNDIQICHNMQLLNTEIKISAKLVDLKHDKFVYLLYFVRKQ